jgi:sarcosine oxidase delta subunit
MSFTITCPVCGKRDLYEFRFGNEDRGPAPDQEGLAKNSMCRGDHAHWRRRPQKEWWCHKDGCGVWFTIWRDTTTGRETDETGAVK